MNPARSATYFLILSALGLGMMFVLALSGTGDASPVDPQERLLVGGAFIVSCVLGISLAVWPGWFRRSGGGGQGPHSKMVAGRGRRGHHPDCDRFETHVLMTKSRALCAGCTGLALGSTASILLTGIYFVLPSGMQPAGFLVLISLGVVFAVTSYVEIAAPARNVFVHVTANALLVVGFFSLVVGTYELSGRLSYGLLGVVISFLLLDTRIQLSSWRHNRICAECRETCKSY